MTHSISLDAFDGKYKSLCECGWMCQSSDIEQVINAMNRHKFKEDRKRLKGE